MWEVLLRAPLGSTSPRKFSMLLATFFVACFGYSLLASPTAHAAPATWEGDNLSYNGNTYSPVADTSELPNDVRSGSSVYQFIDTSANPNLVYFIYFAENVDDPKVTGLSLIHI